MNFATVQVEKQFYTQRYLILRHVFKYNVPGYLLFAVNSDFVTVRPSFVVYRFLQTGLLLVHVSEYKILGFSLFGHLLAHSDCERGHCLLHTGIFS